MQARLPGEGGKALYAFWNGKLAEQLTAETAFALNPASGEYSCTALPWLPDWVQLVTCSLHTEA